MFLVQPNLETGTNKPAHTQESSSKTTRPGSRLQLEPQNRLRGSRFVVRWVLQSRNSGPFEEQANNWIATSHLSCYQIPSHNGRWGLSGADLFLRQETKGRWAKFVQPKGPPVADTHDDSKPSAFISPWGIAIIRAGYVRSP